MQVKRVIVPFSRKVAMFIVDSVSFFVNEFQFNSLFKLRVVNVLKEFHGSFKNFIYCTD